MCLRSNIYKIAGVNIRINTEWDFEESPAFADYVIKRAERSDARRSMKPEPREDIVVDFKIISAEMTFESEPVQADKQSKYYRDNGCLWRAYYPPPWDIPASFMCVDDGQGAKSHFVCYVWTRKMYFYKNSLQLFNAIGIEDLLMTRGVMVLHSSYIRWNGRGILFTAPSGTGKSTQAELWAKYEGAVIINGDRAAVSVDGGKWYADGLPIAGSSGIFINERNSLGAVVVLRQAERNRITQIKGIEAVGYILNQIFIQGQFSASYTRAVAAAVDMADSVPVFMLECRPDIQAVETLRDKLVDLDQKCK